MESPSNEDSVNLILDDLESLQGLLDEELAALNIPLLDDVVDPDQKAAFDETGYLILENQVPAVQNRDWKKIEKTNGGR